MAKKSYFIRTADGQKGPYSLSQMKASIKAKTLSPYAEYRVGEDGGWLPIEKLASRVGQEEASRPRERYLSEDQRLPPPKTPDNAGLRALFSIAILVVGGIAYFLWHKFEREGALGRPCKVPADCPGDSICMQTIQDGDRSIDPVGYCTYECSDSTDCQGKMACGEAMLVDEQKSNKWDGTYHRGTHVCVKP